MRMLVLLCILSVVSFPSRLPWLVELLTNKLQLYNDYPVQEIWTPGVLCDVGPPLGPLLFFGRIVLKDFDSFLG